MNSAGAPDSQPRVDAQSVLRRALLLDLEVTQTGIVREVGACAREKELLLRGRGVHRQALEKLKDFSESCELLLGHNLFLHDRAILQDLDAGHPLLRLPVIDTLALSPIAFPQNPYHRLIKDYKLVRESISNPLEDARLAGRIFVDEFHALENLRRSEPELVSALHYLLGFPDDDNDTLAHGMDFVFGSLGGKRPSPEKGLRLASELGSRWGCQAAVLRPSDVASRSLRHSVAYALSWLRIAGSNSVVPPWVRLEYPKITELIQRYREVPCHQADCAYCRKTHNAKAQLKAFFGFDEFRPHPLSQSGGSLQQEIIEAGFRDESLLALLPTGGGKSLCYQLPALVRNQRRGVLTIVISPLQALMKDQVDGLMRRTGTPFAAALYGLLTPPERGDVLRRVALGDLAILYVSPEQLRNRSLGEAIRQREIGCWVFDEAHCLSKWGHDFRPDYLYAGRFIREFSLAQGGSVPPIACFTATAKEAVKDEILTFFRSETGRELRVFEGGVERDNLKFSVHAINDHSKLERIHELLSDRLSPGSRGSGIIFRTTRNLAETTAEALRVKGWPAAHFHAGMTAASKKEVQEQFLAGAVQVICATNAFGMGIDKEDVRIVVHGDTPGSLENYLQEAGRAGRDGRSAECILLFNEEDCERQFRLGAISQLSRRDIAQILRSVRRSVKGDDDTVILTTGEILRQDHIESHLDAADSTADTKVRTAIAWLERAGFLQRDENVTTVFQARPLVPNLESARERIAELKLPPPVAGAWLAILRCIFNAGPSSSLTIDQLALLPEIEPLSSYSENRQASPELVSARVLKALKSMTQAGLMRRDTLFNAFIRHKVENSSRERFTKRLRVDRQLLETLVEAEPDPQDWVSLSLRSLNQKLLDEGCESSTEIVRQILKSLSEDGRGIGGEFGSLDLRYAGRDYFRVLVRRPWKTIRLLSEQRRAVAGLVLETILSRIPADTPPRAELLVNFSLEDLQQAIERHPTLRTDIKDVDGALERGLMYLHEHGIIVLQQGLAIFRAAMKLKLRREARSDAYLSRDFEPLKHHYAERILQVHVMSEYARRGIQQIREALELVLAYFHLGREQFIRRYLALKPELVELATTAQSYQRIVTDLANASQIKIVTAPVGQNLLILAGPGSGKTRTVVHRCAYLLRVVRVRAERILVCCFNRQAASELRKRLNALAGDDARGVTVLTYHGLALRLLGRSDAASANQTPDFDALIQDAVRLLQGKTGDTHAPPDELRERILAGFEHILVDEYQDIDEHQYELISALTGRTLPDPDQKLSILAVGDDDQNIYSFRGANIEFIRRFQVDYKATVHYLVENYRSSRYIIEAANSLIAANRDRMKIKHPIRIDRLRQLWPAGGEFGRIDTESGGRVRIIQVDRSAAQAPAVIAQVRRLHRLGVSENSKIAILAWKHDELADIRTEAESAGLPVRLLTIGSAFPPLNQIREVHRFLAELKRRRTEEYRASELERTMAEFAPQPASPSNPWQETLGEMVAAWKTETNDSPTPVQEALDFLYELCGESRREVVRGEGVLLSTIHAAKGTEFDHVVLISSQSVPPISATLEEHRRTFYVGLTRAKQSLTIIDRTDIGSTLASELSGAATIRETYKLPMKAPTSPHLSYHTLNMRDIHLGYPAQFPENHPIHASLAKLQPGDRVKLSRASEDRVGIIDSAGLQVGQLSKAAAKSWIHRLGSIKEVRVVGIAHRDVESMDPLGPQFSTRVKEWEIPIIEIVAQ